MQLRKSYPEIPRSNLHTHTVLCDGKDTPEELVLAAIEAGMDTLGFSGHCYSSFDPGYCMTREQTAQYREEIARLKMVYGDRLHILCGIEQEYFSDEHPWGYDYIIGSVHYLPKPDGGYFAVDLDPADLKYAVDHYYRGRIENLWKHYFETVAGLVQRTGCQIIGHFDLISKFNEGNAMFDESSPFYLTFAAQAIDKLLQTDAIFEINTGVVAKGYRRLPYPSHRLMQYIASHGGRVTFSSDAHDRKSLMYGFEHAVTYARNLGFGSLCVMTRDGWREIGI